MISKHPGYATLVSKLDAFHEKEADTRVDMAGTPLREYLIEGYEYNYIREFLECFQTDMDGCFESLADMGNEAGNHNQLLYFCRHIMPYMMKDAPGPLQQYFRALKDVCDTAYNQTEMWNEWDDECEISQDMEEIVMYAQDIDQAKDTCAEAPWEEIEACVIQVLSCYLVN